MLSSLGQFYSVHLFCRVHDIFVQCTSLAHHIKIIRSDQRERLEFCKAERVTRRKREKAKRDLKSSRLKRNKNLFSFLSVHMHAETQTSVFNPLDQVRITLEERFLAGF